MAKKAKDSRREAVALQRLAAALAMERPREAVRRAMEALELSRQLGDLRGEAKCGQLLVEIQCQAKCLMEAKRTAKEAQRLCRELSDAKGCVATLQYLTGVYLEAGEQHEAIQCVRSSGSCAIRLQSLRRGTK